MHNAYERHFAPVVPLNIAQFLRERHVLGEYHLLLAHDVLANPEEYRKVYAPIDGKPLDIIMDNSLIELGYPMRVRDVIEAARIVGAKKVVLPDVLGDLRQTLDLVHEAADEFHKLPMDVTAGLKTVAVVQGDTERECFYCLDAYRKLGTEISIPRVLVSLLGSRREVINQAFIMGFRNMHLLGFSDNLIDDIACTRMPGVKGIDSAVPTRAATKFIKMSLDSLGLSDKIGPRGDFWEQTVNTMTEMQKELVVVNSIIYRQWINT